MEMTASLPVTRVLVMEDRAQVERSGVLELKGGVSRIEVGGLPPIAVDRSLRVEVQGATLVDARLVRSWREKPRGGLPADASDLRQRVDALERESEALADRVSLLESRLELLQAARADVLRGIAEGTGHGRPDVAVWGEQLATLSARESEADEALRVASRQQNESEQRLSEAQAVLAAAEGKEHDLECRLVLTLEGHGQASVRAVHLVPCAAWRPRYRASLRGESVLIEAEAVVWQRTGEDWSEVEVQLSTERPTLGTAPPAMSEDMLRLRPKQTMEKKVVDVAVREEVIQSAGESGGSTEMPGLDDGGEPRVLGAAARATVRSDGQPHRVPLFSFESKAQLERVCPAELTGLVFLIARFPNTSGQVLLAGPVDLVRQAGFVGRSLLKFAAPGETVKLSFGNEDGLRIVRESEEKREEARLTGRKTSTRVVRLHVSNARPEPASLVIEERIPVSEVSEVEIRVLGKSCDPAPAEVTRDGVARIPLELGPNGTRTARFCWELSAAAKVAGV